MGQNKKKKKSAPPKIDLSSLKTTDDASKFEVETYDYQELQTSKSETEIKFENDLLYLLDASADAGSATETKSPSRNPTTVHSKHSAKKGKKVKSCNTVKEVEITGDITEIVFSGESEDEDAVNTIAHADEADPVDKAENAEKNTTEKDSSVTLKIEGEKPKKKKKKNKKNSKREDTNDAVRNQLDQIAKECLLTSSNTFGNKIEEASGHGLRQIAEGKKEDIEEQVEDVAQDSPEDKLTEACEQIQKEAKENKQAEHEIQEVSKDAPAEIRQVESTEENLEEQKKAKAEDTLDVINETEISTGQEGESRENSSKSKKNRRKKSKKSKVEQMEQREANLESPNQDKVLAEPTESPQEASEPITAASMTTSVLESPFGKLRSLAAATTVSYLPELHPITTIIGLSHDQILRMKPTDVKIKTLHSVNNLSKSCKNVLQFVQKETDGLFKDAKKREIFVELCVNVALYESAGFNGMAAKHPHMIEWLGKYDELSLGHTGTKITASKKEAHSNNFDYTVFSHIGHILLWAQHLQDSSGIETILDKYHLELTRKSTMASLGGYHLWDRIRRNPKTINTKRWKHIQKFRQNFPFEQNQFVLTLRYMRLGISLPAEH